jgi:hypothetical protein
MLGSLFLTLPTRALTGQQIISPDGASSTLSCGLFAQPFTHSSYRPIASPKFTRAGGGGVASDEQRGPHLGRLRRSRRHQVRNGLFAGGRWIRTLGPPSAATPLSDRESPLQASFPRNLGLRFAPKASTPSRKSSELPRKVTGSSQRSPLHAAGTRRCLHFGKCACKQAATRFPPIKREASPIDGRWPT